jgi:hypothetical protein
LQDTKKFQNLFENPLTNKKIYVIIYLQNKERKVKKMKKAFLVVMVLLILCLPLVSCDELTSSGSQTDTNNTINVANKLQENQPTPSDIDYSLERYNLIRRAYWVNGQREKANALPCEIEKPLGYIVLLTESGAVVGSFIVDGKVSSLNSFLTPDSEYYEYSGSASYYKNKWIADVDGSYGENDNGIFFFTPDGKYIEWTGTYLYSDIPMTVDNPVIKVSE